MSLTPIQLTDYVSWGATFLGLGLWAWSWLGVKDPIARLRFSDCAVVLLFSSVLARIVTQDKAMAPFDWAMIFLAPLFIAAALWRLARTACPTGER